MKKFGLMMIGAILLFMLTGCRQEPECFDEILYIYERIARGESTIADIEQQRHNLKEREKELRGPIIQGGADSNLAVLSYIEETMESIRSRQNLVGEQIRIMGEKKEELESAALLIESIENEEIKEKFLQVQLLHGERYETFIRWSDYYLETTREEIRFYTLLQEDEQNLQDLENITIELNQRAMTEGQLQESLSEVSVRLNGAINALARALERREV